MTDNKTIQVAISKYKEMKESLGKIPSSREFFQVFSKRTFYTLFEGGNAYSRLQELAGDSPNKFSSEKSELNNILIRWGGLARKTLSEYKKLPVQYDWQHNSLKPSVSGIEKSHNIKWSSIPDLFREHFSSDSEWQDVISAIPESDNEPVPEDRIANEECFVYLMKDLRNGSHKIGISNNP